MIEPDDRRTITVYRDHPEWASNALAGRRWFQMPSSLLRELFVVQWSVPDDRFDEELARIETEHPGAVFVY